MEKVFLRLEEEVEINDEDDATRFEINKKIIKLQKLPQERLEELEKAWKQENKKREAYYGKEEEAREEWRKKFKEELEKKPEKVKISGCFPGSSLSDIENSNSKEATKCKFFHLHFLTISETKTC